MNITPEEIARLRALEAKATGAEWHGDDYPYELVEAVPGVLDEIERLRADLREAVALLDEIKLSDDNEATTFDKFDALLAKHKEQAQ